MTKIKLNLRMFNGDGGAGAAPAAGSGEAGIAAENAPVVLEDGTQVDDRLAARMKKQEERRKARGQAPLYQRTPAEQPAQTEQQAETPQAEEPENPASDLEARWKELKKGEMRELYKRDVQETIQKRFKNQTDSQATLDMLMPAINKLAKQRGIEEGNLQAFVDNVEKDDSLIEEAAAEAGMTVESYRTMEQLRQENERYQAEKQASQREEALRRHFANLTQQAEALKARIPGFDLQAELKNDTFLRMTSPEGGLDVETAYYAIHHRELEPQAMAYGIQKAQEQMAQTIAANRARPAEGAISGGQATNFQIDPRTMTKAQRQDLIRRARRGERIEL